MLELEITPVQVFPDTATKLRVPRVEVRRPGENGEALVSWQLLSSKGEPLKDGSILIGGNDYNSWGTQDDYLLYYVMSKLGVQELPPTQPDIISTTAASPEVIPENLEISGIVEETVQATNTDDTEQINAVDQQQANSILPISQPADQQQSQGETEITNAETTTQQQVDQQNSVDTTGSAEEVPAENLPTEEVSANVASSVDSTNTIDIPPTDQGSTELNQTSALDQQVDTTA